MVAEPSALVERYPLNRINSALDELKAQKTTDLLVFVPLNIPASQPAAVTATW